jgi:hypothetical protein
MEIILLIFQLLGEKSMKLNSRRVYLEKSSNNAPGSLVAQLFCVTVLLEPGVKG